MHTRRIGRTDPLCCEVIALRPISYVEHLPMLSQSRRNTLTVIWVVIFMIATLLVAGYAFGLNEANSYQNALTAGKYVLEVRNIRRVVANMETSSLNYIISGSIEWRTRYSELS